MCMCGSLCARFLVILYIFKCMHKCARMPMSLLKSLIWADSKKTSFQITAIIFQMITIFFKNYSLIQLISHWNEDTWKKNDPQDFFSPHCDLWRMGMHIWLSKVFFFLFLTFDNFLFLASLVYSDSFSTWAWVSFVEFYQFP